MAAIVVNLASVQALSTLEQRALTSAMNGVNRTRVPPLANIKEYLEYLINEERVPALLLEEASEEAAKQNVVDLFKNATDAKRAAAIAALK